MDDPAAALFIHSFEVNADDQDIGNAESNRPTRARSTEQEIQPKVDFGAGGVRFGLKCDCGRLYNVAFRFCLAKCQRFGGRTTSTRENVSANTRVSRRRFEGYPVGPAATRCRAAGEWILIATKHCSASARFNYDTCPETEHYGRTGRHQEDICSAFDADGEG